MVGINVQENFRHINIRHFFVKDRVNKGEKELTYCPTHPMIADYLTKPLQGKMLKTFRDFIMGYVHINDPFQAIELSAKEHIENSKNVTLSSFTNNRKEYMMTFSNP